MTPRPRPVTRIQTNHGPVLDVLGGRFEFGGTAIPFFTAHMTISQVSDYLKTPNELSAWSDEGTELEALFQRSLDYQRVRDGILPYLTLQSSQRPKFFNALTIALVPLKNGQLTEFNNGSFKPPGLPGDTAINEEDIIHVGPISLGFYRKFDPDDPDTYTLGQICWNRDQTACVAIDGQHRLYALKTFHRIQREAAESTRVAVIFLLPDPSLGYKGGAGGNLPIVKLLRSVFIDLNKHAKAVKRSRLILLDDVDPLSLIVRRIVGKKLESVETMPIAYEDWRLPLALVDWHSDDAKFDQGPYLTSILMLDRIVQSLLDCKSVTDWTKAASVDKQHKAFKAFGYVPSDQCVAALNELQEAEEAWQKPFSYPQDDLNEISEKVGGELAQYIFQILTELKPYEEVLDLRFVNQMLTADFSSWFERYSGQDSTTDSLKDLRTVEEHIRSRPNPPHIETWKNIVDSELPTLKDDSLLFKVVFQDAMFRTLQQLWKRFPLVVQEGEYPAIQTPENRELWTRTLIKTVNRLLEVEPDIWKLRFKFQSEEGELTSFWRGSMLKVSDDTVDFTSSAMHRASNLLLLACLLCHARDSLPAEDWIEGDYEAIKDRIEEYDTDYRRALETTESRIKVGASNNPGAMRRIVLERSPDLEYEDEDEFQIQVEKEFLARAGLLVSLLTIK
jgi:hypothetical protein